MMKIEADFKLDMFKIEKRENRNRILDRRTIQRFSKIFERMQKIPIVRSMLMRRTKKG